MAGDEPHILLLALNCHLSSRGGRTSVSVGLYPARSRLKRNMGQSAEASVDVEVGVAGPAVGSAGVGSDNVGASAGVAGKGDSGVVVE